MKTVDSRRYKASTIRLDGDILKSIALVKPDSQSLSSYIREVVEGDVRRRQLREAGQRYRQFLEQNPGEAAWLNEWAEADLDRVPESSNRPKK